MAVSKFLPAPVLQVIHKITGQKYRDTVKIFCIGKNKTGTTSMARLFRELGIRVGPQREAEKLTDEWTKKKYDSLVEYIRYRGVAFQDIPFSLPGTYKMLDKNFPDAKFILTVRDSPEAWYDSLTRFHSKLFGNGKLPTKADLQNATYLRKGWAWEINRLLHDTPEEAPYQRDVLIRDYIEYNSAVREYFKHRPEKLLVVNLKDSDAAERICTFLNTSKHINKVPWENKTADISVRSK